MVESARSLRKDSGCRFSQPQSHYKDPHCHHEYPAVRPNWDPGSTSYDEHEQSNLHTNKQLSEQTINESLTEGVYLDRQVLPRAQQLAGQLNTCPRHKDPKNSHKWNTKQPSDQNPSHQQHHKLSARCPPDDPCLRPGNQLGQVSGTGKKAHR